MVAAHVREIAVDRVRRRIHHALSGSHISCHAGLSITIGEMHSHAAEDGRPVFNQKSPSSLLNALGSFAPRSPWCTIGVMIVIQQGALGPSFLHDALQIPCRHDRAELTPRPLAGCPADTADE